MVGEYEIRGRSIVHLKNSQPVAVVETDVEDPAALILDAVRVGKAGPFEIAQRYGRDVVLFAGSNPMPALPLIRAALNVTA